MRAMDQVIQGAAIEVRHGERELRIGGSPVSLGARAFDVLVALMERRDRVVSKNELLDIVWPDTVVGENNLQAQVSQLRKLLGPKAIATIPGRGYRFTLPMPETAPAVARAGDSTLVPDTDLVGRDVDIEAVMALADAHRLVTIAGAGGIGKTRLAQAIAALRDGRHAHGVCWVDLSAIGSGERIPTAIASVADLHLPEGPGDAALARAVEGRDLFLVLDNCEHLVKDLAVVVPAMLGAAPKLRILATSQEVLQLPAEHVYRLETLSVPPAGTPLAAARRYAAIQLLEQRARAANGRFALREDAVAGAIDLCRHLDGIPLAIEMAAARLPLLGPDALVTRLDERMRLLRSSFRGAPARQQTLRATLDWSHSLLDATEQAVFRRLGIFVGSFRLESAQRVAAWKGLDEWTVLDALAALVDKSLVQVEAGDVPRYRLLETSRLYALEQLEKQGEVEEAFAHHGEAMTEISREARQRYWSTSTEPSFAPWFPEYDDTHAAFERAAAKGDAVVAAATGRLLVGIDFERNVYANVRARKQAAMALLPKADPLTRLQILHIMSHFRWFLIPGVARGEVERERLRVCRELAAKHPDDAEVKRQLYFALWRYGTDLAPLGGTREDCLAAFAEARAMEDPSWTPHFRWFLPSGVKNAAVYWDDAGEIVRCAEAMTRLATEARWPRALAQSVATSALGALLSGDAREAVRLADEAAAELRRLHQHIHLVETLSLLCAACMKAGDLEAARAAARQAVELPWSCETATAYMDQVALLAALGGRDAEAAALLGFADAGYSLCQDRRHTISVWAEQECMTRIGSGDEMKRHRDAGAKLTDLQALAIARAALL